MSGTRLARDWAQHEISAPGQRAANRKLANGTRVTASTRELASRRLQNSASQVSAGALHSLALLADGIVRAFGRGFDGQLGYGSTTSVGITPDTLPSLQGPVSLGGVAKAVAAGGFHSLALLADGTVRAFGGGSSGQLGYGSTSNVGNTPFNLPSLQGAVPLGGTAVSVAAGYWHSLVRLADGTVRAFGSGFLGGLGYGSTSNVGDSPTSLPSLQGPVPLGGMATDVSGGHYHSLVLLVDGTVRAFGYGGDGRLGYGSTNSVGSYPSSLPSLQGPVLLGGIAIAVSAGGYHSLVVLTGGTVRAFGNGGSGQLGYGSATNVGDTPSTVPSLQGPVPLGDTAVAVSAGDFHSLVLLADGTVRAFGDGFDGQLGYGSTASVGGSPSSLPSQQGPVPLGGVAIAVSAGGYHSLVLLDDGTVRAFGHGDAGQLGYGSYSDVGGVPETIPLLRGPVPLIPASPTPTPSVSPSALPTASASSAPSATPSVTSSALPSAAPSASVAALPAGPPTPSDSSIGLAFVAGLAGGCCALGAAFVWYRYAGAGNPAHTESSAAGQEVSNPLAKVAPEVELPAVKSFPASKSTREAPAASENPLATRSQSSAGAL